jgi:hypothetical protein
LPASKAFTTKFSMNSSSSYSSAQPPSVTVVETLSFFAGRTQQNSDLEETKGENTRMGSFQGRFQDDKSFPDFLTNHAVYPFSWDRFKPVPEGFEIQDISGTNHPYHRKLETAAKSMLFRDMGVEE